MRNSAVRAEMLLLAQELHGKRSGGQVAVRAAQRCGIRARPRAARACCAAPCASLCAMALGRAASALVGALPPHASAAMVAAAAGRCGGLRVCLSSPCSHSRPVHASSAQLPACSDARRAVAAITCRPRGERFQSAVGARRACSGHAQRNHGPAPENMPHVYAALRARDAAQAARDDASARDRAPKVCRASGPRVRAQPKRCGAQHNPHALPAQLRTGQAGTAERESDTTCAAGGRAGRAAPSQAGDVGNKRSQTTSARLPAGRRHHRPRAASCCPKIYARLPSLRRPHVRRTRPHC